jgi:hypothetical protein
MDGTLIDRTTRVRSLMRDPRNVALVAVFLLMSMFYLWRATSVAPLALHGSPTAQYNALADAFLHLRLWIAQFPATALGPEPLNPAHLPPFLAAYGDDSLSGGRVYLTWGPAPVLVLLVPLHLLGYEPSSSVIMTPFAIVGLGFALAALRVCLRSIADVPLWMCILSALVLACASVVPELLRVSQVYHEAIAGGYCFTMAGIWLAVSAIVDRRASWVRLGLMSLCFGLAAGSRPTLVLTLLILVPVYASLRSTRPHRGLLLALAAPVSASLLLLAVYNYARYGNPLETGEFVVIGSPAHQYLTELSYLPVGTWSYLLAPPRINAIFPFISIIAPQMSYPLQLPAHYVPDAAMTGGLLAMTPTAIFVLALPWMWRRRPALLGSLGPLLIVMSIAGVGIVLFLACAIPMTTERYRADYATLFVFGGLVVWLALSTQTHRGWRRRSMRVGGGLLAVWSCATGIAVGTHGLQTNPDTWRTLVNLGSPLSTAIATAAGHPILAEIYAPWTESQAPERYGLSASSSTLWLSAGNEAYVTIVSPNSRDVTLVAKMSGGPALPTGSQLEAHVRGPGSLSHFYRVAVGGGNVRIVTHLSRGVNQLTVTPIGVAKNGSPVIPLSYEPGIPLMVVADLHIA